MQASTNSTSSMRDRIRRELEVQQREEGRTRDTALLLRVLDLEELRTHRDWQALVTVEHKRYGRQSYQTRRYHYPSPLLLALRHLFTK